MKLLVVRHGESTWNAEGRYQGQLDPPLSDRGRAQAAAVATHLREQQSQQSEPKLEAVVTSPLARARETAAACAQALGLTLQIDERLIEISHGLWEGKTKDDVVREWPAIFAAWRTQPETVRFPGGEALGDVNRRLGSFLDGLHDSNHAKLIVTHDVIVRLAVLRARHLPLSEFHQVSIENASISEFESRGGKLDLVRLNDFAHVAKLRSDLVNQAL